MVWCCILHGFCHLSVFRISSVVRMSFAAAVRGRGATPVLQTSAFFSLVKFELTVLGVLLDDRQNWSANANTLHRTGLLTCVYDVKTAFCQG